MGQIDEMVCRHYQCRHDGAEQQSSETTRTLEVRPC